MNDSIIKKKKHLLVVIFSLLIVVIGSTFAWLSYRSRESALVLTIGEINKVRVTLSPYQMDREIIPALDYTEEPYVQVEAVNNKSDIARMSLYYIFNNIDSDIVTYLNDFYVTIERSSDNVNYSKYVEINNFYDQDNINQIILEEEIPANTTYYYRVYLWLDGSSVNQSDLQNANIKTELRAMINTQDNIVVDLPDGLIPVVIANNGDVTTIDKDNNNWYDYNSKKWANAVLVKENGVKTRTAYLEDNVSVDKSDILAYYVYIPRYSYKIWETGTSSTGSEQAIEIMYENKDMIKSKGNSVNSYLTHPAFTFGNQEVNGIWVGKFETSQGTSSTTGDTTMPTVLPGVAPWTGQNVSTQFQTSLKFSGGTLSNGAVSFTGSNVYGLTKNTDSHMMKNSEWGAVAYLSHSQSGTCTNGECTEVGINNYYNSGYKTGCGDVAGTAQSTVCGYEFGTASEYPQSTNGNITGIYDMSGGTSEYVMGVFANSNGDLWSGYSLSSSSGFNGMLYSGEYTAGINFPPAKYYDVYKAASGTTISADTACNGSVCYGHALSETSGWYSDYAGFVSDSIPWFARSGNSNGGTGAGVFIFNGSDGYISERTLRSVLIDTGSLNGSNPVLDDGMIPVNIANNGTVTTIDKEDPDWYNYEDKKWANSVLVNNGINPNKLTDLSGNNTSYTLTGATFNNGGLNFDGVDDNIFLPYYDLTTLSAFTAEVKFKADTLDYANNEIYLLGNANSGGLGILISYTTGEMKAILRNSTTSSYVTVYSGIVPTVGTTYALTVVYTGSQLKLYVDGVLKDTEAFSGTIGLPTNDTRMAIGCDPSGTSCYGCYFDGIMYFARMYNRVLSDSEITNNYNGNAINDDLIFGFDFMNGNQHNYDLSGNNTPSTITGATVTNEGLSFDGTNDYVLLPEYSIASMNAFTGEVKFKADTINTSGAHYIIGNLETGGFGLSIASGVIKFLLYSNTLSNYVTLNSEVSVVTGKTYTVTFIYTGNELKIYVDGVLIKTQSFADTIKEPNSDTHVVLGCNPYGTICGSEFFDGTVYFARMYDRALSDSEIISNNVGTVSQDGLLFNFDFKDGKRSIYKNTDGMVIDNNDILGYYVWIPRYSYKMNGVEEAISISFNDTPDGYRSHPAFDFNGGIKGFWVGKFETSAPQNYDCYVTPSSENCYIDDIEPLILPNLVPYHVQYHVAKFTSSLLFSGGTLSNGSVSFVGSSKYGLTAGTDSHMMKNSEWGAVAYLTNSNYGLCTNGACTEIGINNYQSTAKFNRLTGCGDVAGSSATDVCINEFGTVDVYPQSTNGNISGVFDMVGASAEAVMAVFADSSGNVWSGFSASANSGFNGYYGQSGTTYAGEYTSGIDFPPSKYYDVYKATSGITISATTACNGGVCYGHALSETSGWYSDAATFVSTSTPWLARGGSGSMGTNAGLFSSYSVMGKADGTWRSVLATG